MKKIFLIIALVLTMGQSFAQKSQVKFDAYEWDFGAVEVADGTVCHTFTFKNVSKQPVKIAKTIPSCECINAYYADEEVAPGASAKVLVALSPKNSEGKTYRSIELLDANGKTLASLSTKAQVQNSPAFATTAGHKYPYQDTSLSYEERVENLISLLTPEEKVGLMMNKSVSVDRLGIPSYNWWRFQYPE